MIKKDKALVEDKDAFLQLAAHYLRTPIAIVGSSVDLLTHAFNYDTNLANKLIAIATNLREKSEQILARTNESPNVDKITAEDENAFKRRILRSPIFWLPITLSVVLTLLVNWVVTSLGGQDLDTGFIIGQMLSIILAGIVLYTAVREFTMYHEKEVKLEEYRVKARALDNIKNQFIADVYQDLSYDVAELATHDMQTIQNDIVRNSLVDASTRLGKLIERFATLLSVQKGNLELSQFSLDSLINQAIAELSLDMPNQPSVTIPTSLHQDKRMLLKVIETILTTMSGKGSVKDFRFKATTTHNGSLKLEISGHTKYKLLSTSGNLFSASLAATDIQHYNYDEPTPVSTTIDATSSTDTMNNTNTINANYTTDADNANANNPNENNDDANTANNLDIYLSKLIVNRLGGKLSIKQTGEKAVVGLVVPVSE
jgi:signal transduction histidine kinase